MYWLQLLDHYAGSLAPIIIGIIEIFAITFIYGKCWYIISIRKNIVNRPSSVNLKLLVHKHNKTGNKCHTLYPSASPAVAMHTSCNQEYDQSYLVRSHPVLHTSTNDYVTQNCHMRVCGLLGAMCFWNQLPTRKFMPIKRMVFIAQCSVSNMFSTAANIAPTLI